MIVDTVADVSDDKKLKQQHLPFLLLNILLNLSINDTIFLFLFFIFIFF